MIILTMLNVSQLQVALVWLSEQSDIDMEKAFQNGMFTKGPTLNEGEKESETNLSKATKRISDMFDLTISSFNKKKIRQKMTLGISDLKGELQPECISIDQRFRHSLDELALPLLYNRDLEIKVLSVIKLEPSPADSSFDFHNLDVSATPLHPSN